MYFLLKPINKLKARQVIAVRQLRHVIPTETNHWIESKTRKTSKTNKTSISFWKLIEKKMSKTSKTSKTRKACKTRIYSWNKSLKWKQDK